MFAQGVPRGAMFRAADFPVALGGLTVERKAGPLQSGLPSVEGCLGGADQGGSAAGPPRLFCVRRRANRPRPGSQSMPRFVSGRFGQRG